jgi:coniferyl-aldehyde dehydrogenase
MQDELPFGGCGNSGMGAYHGEQGFRTFSHAKSVYTATKRDPFFLLRPPYGKALHRLFRFQLRR